MICFYKNTNGNCVRRDEDPAVFLCEKSYRTHEIKRKTVILKMIPIVSSNNKLSDNYT